MTNHNKSYNRYFEGYTEYVTENARTGKARVERIYTGYYYRPQRPAGNRMRVSSCYLILYLFAWGMLIFGGTPSVPGTTSRIVILPMAVSLLALVWMTFPVMDYVMSGEELEQRVYRQMKQITSAGLAGTVSFGAAGVIMLIYAVFNSQGRWIGMLCALSQAAAAASMYIIYYTEKNMVYTRRRSGNVCTHEGEEIRLSPEET